MRKQSHQLLIRMKYHFLPLLLCVGLVACADRPGVTTQSSPDSDKSIGYASVSEALTALKAKPGVEVAVTKPDSWTIVTERSPVFVVWSFAPSGHYAYPAVVRRQASPDAKGNVRVEMTALCQAQKEQCDRLMAEFQKLNDGMLGQMRAPSDQGTKQ